MLSDGWRRASEWVAALVQGGGEGGGGEGGGGGSERGEEEGDGWVATPFLCFTTRGSAVVGWYRSIAEAALTGGGLAAAPLVACGGTACGGASCILWLAVADAIDAAASLGGAAAAAAAEAAVAGARALAPWTAAVLQSRMAEAGRAYLHSLHGRAAALGGEALKAARWSARHGQGLFANGADVLCAVLAAALVGAAVGAQLQQRHTRRMADAAGSGEEEEGEEEASLPASEEEGRPNSER